MASKYNSEFNYRYQVQGETIWEKIKTLQGFLEGRERAVKLAEIALLKLQSKKEKLIQAIKNEKPSWQIKKLKAKLMEAENWIATENDGFHKNDEEIAILEKLLEEAFEIAEPTRINGHSDEEMWEANQANEFTVRVAKDMQSEMIANGRPSAMLIRQAMSNPMTWEACKKVGLIPIDCELITGGDDPGKITLSLPEPEKKDNDVCTN